MWEEQPATSDTVPGQVSLDGMRKLSKHEPMSKERAGSVCPPWFGLQFYLGFQPQQWTRKLKQTLSSPKSLLVSVLVRESELRQNESENLSSQIPMPKARQKAWVVCASHGSFGKAETGRPPEGPWPPTHLSY